MKHTGCIPSLNSPRRIKVLGLLKAHPISYANYTLWSGSHGPSVAGEQKNCEMFIERRNASQECQFWERVRRSWLCTTVHRRTTLTEPLVVQDHGHALTPLTNKIPEMQTPRCTESVFP